MNTGAEEQRVTEPREFTKRQRAALASLERALARAARAGIALCGMDSTLYAYRADDFDRLAEELESAYDVQQALVETSHNVNDGGAYRESGGW